MLIQGRCGHNQTKPDQVLKVSALADLGQAVESDDLADLDLLEGHGRPAVELVDQDSDAGSLTALVQEISLSQGRNISQVRVSSADAAPNLSDSPRSSTGDLKTWTCSCCCPAHCVLAEHDGDIELQDYKVDLPCELEAYVVIESDIGMKPVYDQCNWDSITEMIMGVDVDFG